MKKQKIPELVEKKKEGGYVYHLHEGQLEAWFSPAKYVFLYAGIQSGKTSFLSLLLHREMQRFFLEDGNVTLKDKDPDAYEASQKEVVGIDKNSGNFVTLESDGTYNANLLQATQIGGGDYVAVTATNRLFNDKFMGEIRSLFVDKFDIARYHDAARLFELRDPYSGKFWATHSKDRMYGRIMLYSAQQKGGVESVTARAAMVDEFGMPSFTLNIWDGITGRLSLTKKEEYTGIPSKFPGGRVFGGSIVYYDGGWPRKEIYDRWKAGDKDYKVVHFSSIMNPFFPIETYETKRRTMSTPRFENRYRGRYAVTSGMIYADYDPSTHVVDPFDIPDIWQRYVGIDPGAVHTATVWAARDPGTDIFYIYRVTLDGNKTTGQHVASALSYGEYVSVWVGGAPAESQFRMDWTDAGIRVQQPPIKDVEAGIDRIVSLFKTNHLRIFKTCTLLLDEIASYSRKLDDMGEPTDVIKDKNKYHCLDGARYLFSKLTKPPTTPATLSSSRFGAKSIPGFGVTGRSIPTMGVSMRDGRLPSM